ncbi:chromate resistance protein [Rhodococcus sp. ACS1]|uniref:Chromate resistance protein ChrB n=1 Tax=Rhodococcus sp. ACS1 TaxID=2028570 RepID=UPI000BB15A6E|nr:Chromate resistance protein ChrB [Rhodococcus sp. ACS1]PBC39595.1 chromate resistance protein [Rhodococcus sp. ACS1]
MTARTASDEPADEWVMLAYRIPREPSTPRIAVWRKLRKSGVYQLADGVAVLPASPRTREQFDWVAEEVVEAGGQAEVWTAAPTTRAQQNRMRTKLSEDRAAEYDELTAAAAAARSLPDPAGRAKKLTQLRRRLREIDKRTFFLTAQRDSAEAALRELAAGQPDGAPERARTEVR